MKSAAEQFKEWLDHQGDRLVLTAMAVYGVVISAVCLGKYALLGYDGIDLAYFSQAAWNFLHGRWFTVSIHPHLTLGDHAELLMPLIAPFYAVWHDPRMLLILQSVVMAGAAWPLYRLARRRLARLAPKSAWLAPLIAVAYLCSPLVQNANLFEFHFLPLALPALFWALDEYERGRRWPFLAAAAVAMLAREDVTLVIGAISLLAWIEKRDRFWRWVPALFAAAWFIADMRLIAAFAPAHGYKFAIYYSWLGATPAEAALGVVRHPLRLIAHLVRLQNIEMILGFGMVTAFLPLFAPAALILTAAPFAEFLLGAGGGGELILRTHYVTLFLPGLYLAAIDGLPRFLTAADRWTRRTKIPTEAATVVLLAAVLGSMVILGPWPELPRLLSPDRPALARAAAARELAARVPADAGVVASSPLLPLLANREKLYAPHYQFLGVTQFALTPYAVPEDTRFLAIDADDLVSYEEQFKDTVWAQPHVAGGYERLRSVAGQPVLTSEGFTLFDKAAARTGFPATIPAGFDFADGLRLTGYASSVTKRPMGSVWNLTVSWAAATPPTEDWLQRLVIKDADGRVVFDRTYPFADGLTSSSELRPGMPTLTAGIEQTLPRLLPGTYTPTLALERQTAHLEMNALGSADRFITDRRGGGEIKLPPMVFVADQ